MSFVAHQRQFIVNGQITNIRDRSGPTTNNFDRMKLSRRTLETITRRNVFKTIKDLISVTKEVPTFNIETSLVIIDDHNEEWS